MRLALFRSFLVFGDRASSSSPTTTHALLRAPQHTRHAMNGGVTVVSCRDPAATKRIVDAVTFSAYTHAQLSADTLGPHVLMRLKAGGDTLLLVSEAALTLACTPQRQVVLGVASVPASKVAATVCGCAVDDEFASAAGQLCVVHCPAAAAEDLTLVLIEPTEGGHVAQVLVEWGVQAGAAAAATAARQRQKKAAAAKPVEPALAPVSAPTQSPPQRKASPGPTLAPVPAPSPPPPVPVPAPPPPVNPNLWQPPPGANISSLYLSALHQGQVSPLLLDVPPRVTDIQTHPNPPLPTPSLVTSSAPCTPTPSAAWSSRTSSSRGACCCWCGAPPCPSPCATASTCPGKNINSKCR